MKKHRLKNYLKLGILLFGITIFVIACEKDNFAEEKTLDTLTEELPISIKSISISEAGETFNTLKNKYQLDNHFGLQQNGNIQHRAAEEPENSGIIIYTDNVKEITKENYISYTMLIKSLDIDPDTFYNITIENKNGVDGMFVTQYKKSGESSISSISTKRINDLQENIGKEDFGNEDEETIGGGSSGSGGDNTQYPYDCDGTVIPTTVAIPILCTCENHAPWQNCSCGNQPYWIFVTTYECIFSSGSNPPDNTDPTTGNPNTSGPGDGNNGNSNNDSGDTLNTSLTSPTGGELKTPCKKIKELFFEYTDFKQKLIDLSQTVNEDHENAVGLHKDGTEFTESGSTTQPIVDLEEDPNSKYIVIAHTHYETSTASPQTDTYSVFSPGDLQFMAQRLKEGELKASKFVAFLITGKGTRYALTIDDTSKFLDFFKYTDTYLKWKRGESATLEEINHIQNVVVPINDKYFDKETVPIAPIKKENEDNQAVLEAFLQYMDEADMGATLYSMDETFTTFTRLNYDALEDDNIKETPCN